jgi:hypothetical protein
MLTMKANSAWDWQKFIDEYCTDISKLPQLTTRDGEVIVAVPVLLAKLVHDCAHLKDYFKHPEERVVSQFSYLEEVINLYDFITGLEYKGHGSITMWRQFIFECIAHINKLDKNFTTKMWQEFLNAMLTARFLNSPDIAPIMKTTNDYLFFENQL